MSSKEQRQSNDKRGSKQRSPKPTTKNLDVLAHQQTHPATIIHIIQQARLDPRLLTPSDVLQFQRTIGNQAVGRLMAQTAQHQSVQEKVNNTGLPDNLKSGIENLSDLSMDDVIVHYNSDKPAQLQAQAYAQGRDIHLASRQEKHLPYEAWHVAQQKQGRVKPSLQMKGTKINDDGLEKETDVMGAKAFTSDQGRLRNAFQDGRSNTIQRAPVPDGDIYKDDKYPDVKLQKIKTGIYKIINDGKYKDQVVVYDVDEEAYFYKHADGNFADYDKKFDISLVSSGPIVEAEAPTAYNNIGEIGKGVGYVGTDTTLRTTGLNTCVGWLLYNDTAAYLTHIVVSDPKRVLADGSISKQISGIYDTFVEKTGTKPTTVHIHVDKDQPSYKGDVWQQGWMKELVPASCEAIWTRGFGFMVHVVRASGNERKEWDGPAIKVRDVFERFSDDMKRYKEEGYSLF